MSLIDCRDLSNRMRNYIHDKVMMTGIVPTIAIIKVGNDPAANTYLRNKCKACEAAGFRTIIDPLIEESRTEEVISAIYEFANRDDVNGIIVEMPLPSHIDSFAVRNSIPCMKDVDALSIESIGRLHAGTSIYAPCTPMGILYILDSLDFKYDGTQCVMIGRSDIVGKPMAAMLTARNATVTLCHTHTPDIRFYTENADLIICAVGKPHFLTADMVSNQAIVIDCGINYVDGELVGDADTKALAPIVKGITPVPGGVGLMTVTALLQNTLRATYLQRSSNKYTYEAHA